MRRRRASTSRGEPDSRRDPPLLRKLLIAFVLLLCAAVDSGAEPTAVERGEYVLRTAGGCGCHTDTAPGSPPLAGGRAIRSPYGTFYGTNITPDRETGIGAWSLNDFVRAMTEGIAPNGSSYFPVFPYTSFTRMSDQDLGDLWAYLSTRPAVRRPNRPHEVAAPYGWRSLLAAWKRLYFAPQKLLPDPARPARWNRGAYLVNGPGHCGECHTPRGRLGAGRSDMFLAGSADGPEGETAPNITPDPKTGIGEWQPEDVVYLMRTGLDPEGDGMQGLMAEAIEQGYSHLAEEDLASIAVYLKSIPEIRNSVRKKADP